MRKVDLRDQTGITTNALAKLGKNEQISKIAQSYPASSKTSSKVAPFFIT